MKDNYDIDTFKKVFNSEDVLNCFEHIIKDRIDECKRDISKNNLYPQKDDYNKDTVYNFLKRLDTLINCIISIYYKEYKDNEN